MKHPFSTPKHPEKWGFRPYASALLIIGHLLILLALCDFAVRLDVSALTGEVGAILLYDEIGGTLSASGVILWGSALGIDYMERTSTKKKE